MYWGLADAETGESGVGAASFEPSPARMLTTRPYTVNRGLSSSSFRKNLLYRLECGARHVACDAVTALFYDDLFATR